MHAAGLSRAVEPAYRSVPEHADTLGPEVADFNRSLGFGPDPEQAEILDAIFAVDARGRSAAMETAIIACRQNLKTGTFKQAVMGWLFVTDEKLIVWSAHEWDTVKEAFRDLEELIASSPATARRVKHVYRGNGDEAIELKSGARLIFKTRTKGGGRGLSGRKVILDEGFALRPVHMGALLPTLSAQPDPQVLYGSSAGHPESSVLRGVRDRGRAGGDPGLAYFEYCAPPPAEACAAGDSCTHAPTAQGCGCDNPEFWQAANPAMGRRISVDYITKERRALPPEEFGRERMGWWDDPVDAASPLSADDWKACLDPGSQVRGPVAVGFDVAPDRSSAAVAVAGWRDDGLIHGELADHRPGTGWVAARLDEIASAHDTVVLILNPAGAAGSMEKELNRRGFVTKPQRDADRQLHLTGAREFAQACGALADDVKAGTWRHIGQKPLDDAAAGARTRELSDAWAWSQKNSKADIMPLTAVTLARHGLMTYGVGEPVPDPFVIFG